MEAERTYSSVTALTPARAYETKSFGEQPKKLYFSTDCKLMKATFAFIIVNL